jgi:hypothetical protein
MSTPIRKPGIHLVPYILWLGFVDWLTERTQVTHREALADAYVAVQKKGHIWARRLGIGAALLCLLVLFVAHIAAPLVQSVAPSVSRDAIVPASAGLATLAMLILVFVFVRAAYRVFARTYARGLRVWYRRQTLYEA